MRGEERKESKTRYLRSCSTIEVPNVNTSGGIGSDGVRRRSPESSSGATGEREVSDRRGGRGEHREGPVTATGEQSFGVGGMKRERADRTAMKRSALRRGGIGHTRTTVQTTLQRGDKEEREPRANLFSGAKKGVGLAGSEGESSGPQREGRGTGGGKGRGTAHVPGLLTTLAASAVEERSVLAAEGGEAGDAVGMSHQLETGLRPCSSVPHEQRPAGTPCTGKVRVSR